MQTAKDNFDIPLILTPENLASPDLDELSGMTYLSYFMKVDSPGYFATLGWTQQMIPHKNVKKLSGNRWNDLDIDNAKFLIYMSRHFPEILRPYYEFLQVPSNCSHTSICQIPYRV